MLTKTIHAVFWRHADGSRTEAIGFYSDERIARAVAEALDKSGDPMKTYWYEARPLDTTDTNKPELTWSDLTNRARSVVREALYDNLIDRRCPSPGEIKDWLQNEDPYRYFVRKPSCGKQTATLIARYVAQEDE